MKQTALHSRQSLRGIVALNHLGITWLLLGLVAVVGCGGGSATTAHLAGEVTIGGKPLPADAKGGIAFQPANGKAINVPIVDGKYDSPKTPQGTVLVNFHITQPVGPVKTSPRTGKEYQDVASIVPARYDTGVQIEVSEDNLSQNFEL